MARNNELKQIYTKNCGCCYFHCVTNVNELDLDNILLDKKSYEIFNS